MYNENIKYIKRNDNMKKLIALLLTLTQLSALTAMAAVGDVYPQAGMGQTTNNSSFTSMMSQITGEGQVTQTNSVWRYQYTTPTAQIPKTQYQ